MRFGLRMAGVGAALLAGVVSTGTTVFASTATAAAPAAVATWDRGGDHGSDHHGDGDHRGGDHRGNGDGHEWDRHGDGDHRDGDHRGRCDREFRWSWDC